MLMLKNMVIASTFDATALIYEGQQISTVW